MNRPRTRRSDSVRSDPVRPDLIRPDPVRSDPVRQRLAAGSDADYAGRVATARYAGLVGTGGAFVLLVLGAALVAGVVGTDLTAEPAVVGIPSSSWAVRFGIPVLRTLLDLSAAAVAGLGLLPKLLGFDRPDRTESVVGPTRRLAVLASAVWGGSALLSIVLLSTELDPGRLPTPASVWTYVANIAAGKGLLLSAGCAALSFWLARVALRHGENVPAELRIGVALFGLLPLPLTGHALNWKYHDLSMIAMELHVVAATAWSGGLAVLVVFLARRPGLLAVALPRFSRLATWCVVVVAVSGVVNGLLQLALSPISHLPGSLLTTRYGVILLAKGLCMVVVAVIAVRVRRRILPKVLEHRPTAIALWCGWEVVTLGVAFGVAVVLTRTSVTPF